MRTMVMLVETSADLVAVAPPTTSSSSLLANALKSFNSNS